MIKEKITKKIIIEIFLIAIILLILFTWMTVSKYSRIVELEQEIENMEKFNKDYNKAIINFNQAGFNEKDAEYNYDLWSFYYDEGYYYDSIEYCEGARELYVEANSNHQDAITYFEEANKTTKEKYNELINYYIKASDQAIEINWAMYEVCEYFESASNYYWKELYETGDSELEIGNEKIVLHDSLVVDYNKYISKIEMLEEKI